LAQTLNSPESTKNWLNGFFTMLAEEVIKQNGIINKFLDVMQYLDAREEPKIEEVLRDRILSETIATEGRSL